MSEERRENTRVNFHTTATLKFPDNSFENCETRDLSVKGVFVLDVTDQEVGDECDVELFLSGGTSDLALRMRGEVVRSQDEGVAINFYEVDLDSFYHLKNIVYYNSENPDELEENYYEDVPDEDLT